MFPIPLFPQTLENTAIYTVFFNFFMFQGRWPTQTYIQQILQEHCFLQCFYNVFRQKRRNLHVFRPKVGSKHWFLQCFQCSGIQKLFKISLFTVFFHFCQYPLKLRHPKVVEKSRKHNLILGAKPLMTPPPAKADIATAILTNVIEHSVWLFAPQ